jgi:hypothetical protein
VFQLLVGFDIFTDFVAVGRRHKNVCQNYIGFNLQEFVDSLLAIADSHDSHAFVGERKVDNFLNGGRIIGK